MFRELWLEITGALLFFELYEKSVERDETLYVWLRKEKIYECDI